MRKSLIDRESSDRESSAQSKATPQDQWLDVDSLATVQITSEDSLFPIDHAFKREASTGWRASAKGPQSIRLNFDAPVAIRRIHLHIVERAAERSQELALYAATGGEMREVVRQQFTFSPGGSTEEIEDYTVSLDGVTSLELRIDPDRAHDPTHSQHFVTLQSLRLA